VTELPDLVLLDVVMPGIDGFEVCRRLKGNPDTARIPIIFITGRNEEQDEIRGLELGAVDYITKPFSLPIVRSRVRTQLELKRLRDQLERQSMVDGLTGIPNRRLYQDHLALIWGQCLRQRSALSLILMDVDHFKAYNDHYGHQAGDECLVRVAQALENTKRRYLDQVARYGGEEFICILPGTDCAGALARAELMRTAVEALAIPHACSSAAAHVTISLGAACVRPRAGDDGPEGAVALADQALYRAKQQGRNRTIM
jgi:diguanylate cyclase (GGDEF)-like protein